MKTKPHFHAKLLLLRTVVTFACVLFVLTSVKPASATESQPATSRSNQATPEAVLLEANGGRVDWYRGTQHELIAYDAITNPRSRNTDVFIINPDGTGKQCVTCNSSVPEGFVGQPAWHPDGEHLVIQVENANSMHRVPEHMSFGLNNDLWIINKDGQSAKRIWTTELNHAALHAHFNHDGTKLIFAERIPTGVRVPGVGNRTPGGENHWDGWQIRIADFDSQRMEVVGSTAIKPNGDGFYETNDFFSETGFTYSFTAGGRPYVDDIYAINIDGTNMTQLINSPATWEEHGTFSPTGNGDLVFLSSRSDSTWQAPASRPNTLRLELFIRDGDTGEIRQLTHFNQTGDAQTRYLTSDYAWNREGNRIVIQVAPVSLSSGQAEAPQIWLLDFDTSSATP
ncbi:MAG: hypothetical protein GYB66_02350 [Chloroflexi bacterium]|nr:hypothetical protein [Chloroflexota bacterium]